MSEWSTGRCPRCHRTIHIESACLAECSCGWSEDVSCHRCGDSLPASSAVLDDYGHYCCEGCLETWREENEEEDDGN